MPTKKLIVEKARIIFRNFSGKPGQYNAEGDRNFCLVLEPDLAKQLEEEGWNIKWPRPSEDPDQDYLPYVQVKVKYNKYPPKIVLIGARKALLTEEDVSLLDRTEIDYVDLQISPYHWETGGKSGISAYLQTMYVTVVQDPFEKNYRDIPDEDMPDDFVD